jgi:hypothetical protein
MDHLGEQAALRRGPPAAPYEACGPRRVELPAGAGAVVRLHKRCAWVDRRGRPIELAAAVHPIVENAVPGCGRARVSSRDAGELTRAVRRPWETAPTRSNLGCGDGGEGAPVRGPAERSRSPPLEGSIWARSEGSPVTLKFANETRGS